MGRLAGKTAVVTGGTAGIGRAIAERFVEEGAKVAIAARREPGGNLASGSNPVFWRCDVAIASEVAALIGGVVERFGRLDILVNNAGTQLEKTIEATSEAEWDALMSTNLKGVFLTCKAALPHLRVRGGSIINLGSYDGFQADPGLAAYCASKGGVHALSRAIAVDHGTQGIRCNVICPGWIKTEMMEDYLRSRSGTLPPEDAERAIAAQHPIGRLGEPRDIANLALWLASEESGFATGQLFVHDGGLTAHAPYVR